jgi:succinoglycan biosynthesis transport protein ExoP
MGIAMTAIQAAPDSPAPSAILLPHQPALAGPPSPVIFFSDILAAIDRRIVPALFAFLGAAIFVVLVAIFYPAKYTSTSTVLLDRRQQEVVKLDAVLSGLPSDSAVVDSEVDVLSSRTLADRVISELKLDRDPEFGYDPTLATPSAAAPPAGRQGVIDVFLSMLNVHRDGLTYVIQIGFRSLDPAKAARISNAVAKDYLAQQHDAKFDATKDANSWLGGRVKEWAAYVRTAEEKVVQYKTQNNLLSTQGVSLTEQEISGLNAKLSEARADEAQKTARFAAAEQQLRSGSGESLGDATSLSPTIQDLRRQENDIIRAQADMQTRYGERHPELIKVREQKKELDQAITNEIRRIVGSLKADALAARQRTASLEHSLAAYQNVLARSNEAAVHLSELERNAQAARSLYEAFLSRLQQTAAQNGSETPDAHIISYASASKTPSFPSFTMTGAAALLLALIASAATIVIAEMRDRTFRSTAEIEDELGLPVLETVPTTSHAAPPDLIVEKPLGRFAQAFRNLKSGPLFGPGATGRVVAIASALPGEGKTTCALALARALALTSPRVVIVDCDVRASSLTKAAGINAAAGVLEVIAGQVTLADALMPDTQSRALILPSVASAMVDKDLFLSDAAERFFDLLASQFDIVLLDTPPLLPVADARVIARHADEVVVLARWCSTSRLATADAVKYLRAAGVHIAGVLLTRVDLKKQSRLGYAARTYSTEAFGARYVD